LVVQRLLQYLRKWVSVRQAQVELAMKVSRRPVVATVTRLNSMQERGKIRTLQVRQPKGISSDEFFGRNNFDPSAQSEAKGRLQG
jgi:hypothetical protein